MHRRGVGGSWGLLWSTEHRDLRGRVMIYSHGEEKKNNMTDFKTKHSVVAHTQKPLFWHFDRHLH